MKWVVFFMLYWNQAKICMNWMFFIPPLQRSWKGGFLNSPCPSFCPSIYGRNRGCSVSSTILTRSVSYLHILSSNFRRCVVCKFIAKFQKLKFRQIFQICNFDLVLFWSNMFLIQYESIVWVISWRSRGFPQNAAVLVVLFSPPAFLWCVWYINHLVHDCSISSANALEILQSCTKPSISCCELFVILQLKCCGVNNYTEWQNTLWHDLHKNETAPDSCYENPQNQSTLYTRVGTVTACYLASSGREGFISVHQMKFPTISCFHTTQNYSFLFWHWPFTCINDTVGAVIM